MADRLLTISISAFNVENTIRQALDPLLKQSLLPLLDILIVDDGSKDNTKAIVQEYIDRYPDTFRIISKENGGWGSTINTGIIHARGKYFRQLDGDDYISNENLDVFLNFLEKTQADMVYSPFAAFDDLSGAILHVIGRYEELYRFLPPNKMIALKQCEDFLPSMHSVTVRTDLLRDNCVKIMEHCFYTDVEYVLKAYALCETVAFFEPVVYYYRMARDGQSMSLNGVRKHYRDHERMLFHMLEYFEEHPCSGIKMTQIRKRLCFACTMQYIFYMALECKKEEKRELIAFDAKLKDRFPFYYENEKGNQVRMLRRTHFNGYKLVAAQKMWKDKKLRRNLFEGLE